MIKNENNNFRNSENIAGRNYIFSTCQMDCKRNCCFKNDIAQFRQTIIDDIVKHPSLDRFPDLKYTLIGKKQIKLIYEIKTEEILITLFWHCKQDPDKLKHLIK